MKNNIKKTIVLYLITLVILFGVFAVASKFFKGEMELPIGAQINEDIKTAYLFARDHKEVLIHMPCYCGCDKIGHKNNYECYIDENGEYTDHGSLCGGCLSITLDAKKLYEEGRSIEEIKAYIVEKHSPREHK